MIQLIHPHANISLDINRTVMMRVNLWLYVNWLLCRRPFNSVVVDPTRLVKQAGLIQTLLKGFPVNATWPTAGKLDKPLQIGAAEAFSHTDSRLLTVTVFLEFIPVYRTVQLILRKRRWLRGVVGKGGGRDESELHGGKEGRGGRKMRKEKKVVEISVKAWNLCMKQCMTQG